MERCNGLGNSVVPDIPFLIGKAILEAERGCWMKVPLSEQIEAVAMAHSTYRAMSPKVANDIAAALATLRLMQRFEPEVRDLLSVCLKRDEIIPGGEIRVLTVTPSTHGVSAIAQWRDEGSGEWQTF
jgi:hypothetical protein